MKTFMVKKNELQEVLKDILQVGLEPLNAKFEAIETQLSNQSLEVKEIKTYLLGNDYQSGAKPQIEKDHQTVEEVRSNLTVVKANRAERYTSELQEVKAKETIQGINKSNGVEILENIKSLQRSWIVLITVTSVFSFDKILAIFNYFYQHIPK